MNTTEKGNAFEAMSLKLVKEALSVGQLGLQADQCRVREKPKYHSEQRKADIVFDISIEVWPAGAERYVQLFLIECKDYENKIPVNDVEEFNAKMQQVAGVRPKGIIISKSDLQQGAFTYAHSVGMMFIQVGLDNSYQIVFHNVQRNSINSNSIEAWDDIIERQLTGVLNRHCKVYGVRRLRSESIDAEAYKLLNTVDGGIIAAYRAVPMQPVIQYLENNYQLKIEPAFDLGTDARSNPILGTFDRSKNAIRIRSDIWDNDRFPFVLGHEIGHFFLHRQLIMNQRIYDSFRDSEYKLSLGRHELVNDKHWIEWQANCFAAALILPKDCIMYRLVEYQIQQGIRKVGTIFCDTQQENIYNFERTVSYLTALFKVNKTNVINRLTTMRVLTVADMPVHWTRALAS
jgi:hypothetical protein